jgi:hypothetical protein
MQETYNRPGVTGEVKYLLADSMTR